MQSVTSNAVYQRLGTSKSVSITTNYQALVPNGNLQIHEVRNGVFYLNVTYRASSAVTIPARSVVFLIDSTFTLNVVFPLMKNFVLDMGYIRAMSATQNKNDIVNINEINLSAGAELSIVLACVVG